MSKHHHRDKIKTEVEAREALHRPELTEEKVRGWASAVKLRLSDLDNEMEKHPGNLAWWETLTAAAKYDLGQAELRKELREAQLDSKAREEITKRLVRQGSGRLTEAMVKAFVSEDALWQEQHQKVMVCKEWLHILEGVCRALTQKGMILAGLSRSYRVDDLRDDEDQRKARRHLGRD